MSSQESQGPTVLIVDDEASICRVVTNTLKRKGFRAASVSEASELEGALAATAYQIILLDRSMNTEGERPLLPLLRERAPEAKILFFTGDYMSAEDCCEVDGVVQKPINSKELTVTLHKLLASAEL